MILSIPDDLVQSLLAVVEERERASDSENAGDLQRAHLRVARCQEALAALVLGEIRRRGRTA